MTLEYTLTPYTKTNSKQLKDLRHDAIKLLEENIGRTFSGIDCTNVFFGQSPKAKEIKTKINKWDIIKCTSFLYSKGNLKTKRQPTEWEKILANNTSSKGLISKIYKQLIQLNNNKKNQSKNGQKT